MCQLNSIFVGLLLVVTFPTKLVSPNLEFKRESYWVYSFADVLLFFLAGVSSVLGPEFPVQPESPASGVLRG